MELFSFLPLAFMIRSDFRERVVGVLPLIIFGVLVLLSGGIVYGWKESLFHVVGNGIILIFLAVGVILYLSVKYRRGINPLTSYFGQGDVWFLLCLTPVFEVMEYAWFLVLSFSLSMIVSLFTASWRQRQYGIPLVSTVGVCYLFYLLYRFIF